MESRINKNLGIALEKLNKLDFPFLIIGGLICNASLEEHARETKDIDLIFDTDFKNIEEIFRKEFDVLRFLFFPLSNSTTEESFSCFVKINEEIIHIEGRRFLIFNKIKGNPYKIGNHTFNGVPIEFQIAEKIIAIFSIENPEYKHLVDLYSFSALKESSINAELIKYYLNLLLSYKNDIKKKLNLPLISISPTIDIHKEFEGSVLLPLQAQYNYSKEYIISELNKWLPKFFN